jgi:lysophospholipase L1-like esterase
MEQHALEHSEWEDMDLGPAEVPTRPESAASNVSAVNGRPDISLGRKLLFSLLLFVAFFGVLELLLRVVTTGSFYLFESNPHQLDAHGSFGLKPDTETWWYGFHYDVNSSGFRMSREVGPKRGLRVLALGDSVTEGMGVRSSADTWPFQLEREAAKSGIGDLESVNTGIQGWSLLRAEREGLVSAEFTRFLRETAPELEPDVVVYAVCLNDIPSTVHTLFEGDNSRNRRRFALFPERSREWLKRKAIYRLLRDGYREARFHNLDYSSAPAPRDSGELWPRVSTELATLKELVEQMDARLLVVIVPYSYQLLPQNNNLLSLNQHWHSALEENDIPYDDISSRLDEQNVLDHFALGDYIHLNEDGHALVADAALQLIHEELRLEPGGLSQATPASGLLPRQHPLQLRKADG